MQKHMLELHINLSCSQSLKFTTTKSGDNINLLTFVRFPEELWLLLRLNIHTRKDAQIFLVDNNKSERKIKPVFFCLKIRNRDTFPIK